MTLPSPGLGAAVFVAAFAVRAGWVVYDWSLRGVALEFGDERLHWELARNLIESGTLVSDDGRYAARMPLYPLFLALFGGLGDVGVLLARLAQALLGAATVWIACRVAGAAFGRRAALVAGLLVGLDPYAVFFSKLLLSETLFTLLLVALCGCASMASSRARSQPAWLAAAIAGLGAAAVMTRPSSAGWVVLPWLLLFLDADRRRALARVTLSVAVLAACLLAWGVRNRMVLGDPAWLSTNGGVTLYDAQGPQADGGSNQAFLQELPELRALNEVERDRRLRELALEQMRRDPGRVLRLAWVKLLRTWSLTPNVEEYRGGMAGVASAAYTLVVLVLAVAGLWWGRSNWRLHVLLWTPVVYFTLVHCVYIGSLRYRVPLMPLLAIAAAAAFAARTGAPEPSGAVPGKRR